MSKSNEGIAVDDQYSCCESMQCMDVIVEIFYCSKNVCAML